MTGELSAEDRILIERTRKVNKTLSMFVFALQEQSRIPIDGQLGIADLLVALAATIRTRADRQTVGDNGAVIEGASSWPLALEPGREMDAGP